MSFKVKSKKVGTNKVKIAYAVKGEGAVQFLFYIDGNWKWEDSGKWEPVSL